MLMPVRCIGGGDTNNFGDEATETVPPLVNLGTCSQCPTSSPTMPSVSFMSKTTAHSILTRRTVAVQVAFSALWSFRKSIRSVLETPQRAARSQHARSVEYSPRKLDHFTVFLFFNFSLQPMSKTVLVIGSGGREACVAATFACSPTVERVYFCPGNGGTRMLGDKVHNLASKGSDRAAYLAAAQEVKPDLIFIGPEAPLVMGAVDELTAHGFKCFGPTQRASELEGSKAFSKDFFARHDLPTATYQTFDNAAEAKKYVNQVDWNTSPVVVKASGLCAGKGVYIPETAEQAQEAVSLIMEEGKFGQEGATVVIEERLQGEEVSVLAFCDGTTSVCMPPAQDHKRVGENDTGLNTGGMGAYTPAPCVDETTKKTIEGIVQRTVTALKSEDREFVGVLFAGLMLTETGPKLLEYNVRMGDPETQVVLPLLKSDLYQVCEACVEGRLSSTRVEWKEDLTCATVVIAAKGYPESYPKGMPIGGFDQVPEGAVVFHAGTAMKDDKIVASGGRVLAVSGLGATLQEAVAKAYDGVKAIQFDPADSKYFRSDIGHRALGARKKPKH